MLRTDESLPFHRRRRDTLRIVGALALVAAAASAVGGVSAEVSAASGGKLTICHRTHSTTNPYRRITVSVSAANGSSANDHTHHSDPPFDLSTTYPPNAKHWGDVIPDNANGGTGSGLNWVGSALGQAIFLGATHLSGNYAGTCGAMTAQQFFDTEVAAGVPVPEILADLDEQGAVEDEALLAVIGSFSSPSGASASFSTSTTAAPTTAAPTTAAPTTAAPTTAAPTTADATTTTAAVGATTTTTVTANPTGARVAGIAWFDRNRDGVHQDSEPPLPGVAVELQGSAAQIPVPESVYRSAVVMAAPVIVTGADGRYSFSGLAAGTYRVTLHTEAAGVSRFWDTDGVADWTVEVVVPAEGLGIADVAAVGTAHVTGTVVWATTSAPVDGALVECHWMGIDGIADNDDDVTFVTHASASGAFELPDVPGGAYRCVASDAATGQLAWFALAVTDVDVDAGVVRLGEAGGGTTSSTLPRTGGSGRPVALFALLLLGAGSLLASMDSPFARRRRGAR